MPWTIDCGWTTTSMSSYPIPNRWCASITSRPLFISVAESIVIFAPMLQVGWASASATVTSASDSAVRPRNGPPDAVRAFEHLAGEVRARRGGGLRVDERDPLDAVRAGGRDQAGVVGAGRERARAQAGMDAQDLERLRPDRAGRAQDGHRSHKVSVGGVDRASADSAVSRRGR